MRIQVPDDLAAQLQRTREEPKYLRLRALDGLVERGLISSGRAAELAAVSRREFLDWCGRWHVLIHPWDADDLVDELAFAGERRGALMRIPNRSPAAGPRPNRPAPPPRRTGRSGGHDDGLSAAEAERA